MDKLIMKLFNNNYYSVMAFLHIERIHVGIELYENKSFEVDLNTLETKHRDSMFIGIHCLFFSVLIFIYI